MNVQPIETTCNIINISRNIELTSRKEVRPHGQPIVADVIKDEKEFQSHAADAITDREKLNDIILEAYLNGDTAKITAFIFGINTGFRVSDILDIRVCDIMTDGKCNDWYAVREQKTSKARQTWLNDTVKKALEFLVEVKGLQPMDYLFCADKNRWLKKFVDLNNPKYLESHKPQDARVDYKYDERGNKLPEAPILTRTYNEWLRTITEKLDIEEHCSSHCMRQTYSYWFKNTVSQQEIDELRKSFVGVDDARLMQIAEYSNRLLSKSLNHSSQRVTDKHYNKALSKHEKTRQLMLNLGAEAVDMYVSEVKGLESTTSHAKAWQIS